MQMNARPGSWMLLALCAPLVMGGCRDGDIVVSVVNTEDESLQGSALVAAPEPTEPSLRLMAGEAQPASTPTEPAGGAPSDPGSVTDPGVAAPSPTADTATEPTVDAKWPTVDASSTGTPAAGKPAAGPGAGHSANHSDPSKGSSRNKYVPDDSRLVTFDELASFWYDAPEPEEVIENPDFKPENQFPDFIQEMDAQKVTLEGYVVPISIEKGRVKAFILSRYVANCCFGMMPELNEWVEVEMPEGEGLDFLPYGTVLTTGTMRVGEVFDEYGYIRSLYRIDAETVVEPDY